MLKRSRQRLEGAKATWQKVGVCWFGLLGAARRMCKSWSYKTGEYSGCAYGVILS